MVKKTSTRQTKKDLEVKIAELEAKLSKLSSQMEAKPKPEPAKPKPATQAKPAPKKEKGTLPKGFETPTKETPPKETPPAKEVQESPKPAPKKERGTLPKGFEPPAQEAAPEKPQETGSLEHAYANASMTDFHQYRAKVTGYSPAANRYFIRRTAPVGKVATTSWHLQKEKVTGYTQPSNQYFATRSRLAYHPPAKTFVGYGMTFDNGAQPESGTQAPKPSETTTTDTPPQQTQASAGSAKSKSEQLAEYEQDYLRRLEKAEADTRKAAEATPATVSQIRGTLPKGFTPPEPEKPKEPPKQRGTLPKGF